MDRYLDIYAHKVLHVNALAKIIEQHKPTKKSILCHGVFDVVHPGHLRHLAYAKSKADILIVSVTSDTHIKKGTYRPHVPENIRALNLAALEMVDYVVIDYNETPIENLEILKPDFFAKGFEYSSSNLNPATQAEQETVSHFGGKIIFTPGDFVLSSSNLISNEPPKLSLEKLAIILQTYNLSYDDLHESIENLGNLSVHVVGDSIVDVLTETSIYGGQTKTPTLSVKLMGEKKYVGGAAIVALHLKAAGANVKFTTMLGEDANSDFIKYELESAGVEINIVQENKRPTTEKRAIVCENYRLLKIDTVDNTPCTVESERQFAKHISNTKADIVIFSDFRHGIFNKKSIPIFISAVPDKTFKVADSQVASRWGNICDFNEFDLITPNEKEARFATADQDSTIGPLAIKLFNQANCKNLILKLGSKGAIALMSLNKKSGPRMISLDAFTTKSIDPVGAGDAMIAYSSLVLQKTKSLPIAFIIGSIAAACVSEREGNSPVSLSSIKDKLYEIQKLSDYELR